MSRRPRWLLATAVLAVLAAAAPAAAGSTDGPTEPVTTTEPLPAAVTLHWRGQDWVGRVSPLVRQGPNENFWLTTPQTAYVDSRHRLHLIADRCGDNWCGAGLNSVKDDFGYGTYRFRLNTRIGALDPTTVIGMFTFNRAVSPGHQELDVELSRWGKPAATARNAQWVVQPWTWDGHLVPFTVRPEGRFVYEFVWRHHAVRFRAWPIGHPRQPVDEWTSTFPHLPGRPQAGTEVHLNVWFAHGEPPLTLMPQEVVFRSFRYEPLP